MMSVMVIFQQLTNEIAANTLKNKGQAWRLPHLALLLNCRLHLDRANICAGSAIGLE